MEERNLYMDVSCKQVNCNGERICGDNFLCRRFSDSERTIVLLSDGMGHGVKANILSTLTSSMLQNFLLTDMPIASIAAMILKTLPICSVRKISYSTFTIVDMDSRTGEVHVVNYDNPRTIVMRGSAPLNIDWQSVEIESEQTRPRTIHMATFGLQKGDYMVVVSDGVTQSGQRNRNYRFGWGEESLQQLISYLLNHNRNISTADLAAQIVSKASRNDDSAPADDMSCVAMHVRLPRKTMLISCPPALKADHARLAAIVNEFDGRKIVSGYHVAEIIASELGLPIAREEFSSDPSVPPLWHIPTLELVTDGLVTSNRVMNTLEHYETMAGGKNSADLMCRMLLDSDHIQMVIGTMRGAEQQGYLSDEFEIRRNLLRNIANLLQHKFGKQVEVIYI